MFILFKFNTNAKIEGVAEHKIHTLNITSKFVILRT